jgi:hypothetical protein
MIMENDPRRFREEMEERGLAAIESAGLDIGDFDSGAGVSSTFSAKQVQMGDEGFGDDFIVDNSYNMDYADAELLAQAKVKQEATGRSSFAGFRGNGASSNAIPESPYLRRAQALSAEM